MEQPDAAKTIESAGTAGRSQDNRTVPEQPDAAKTIEPAGTAGRSQDNRTGRNSRTQPRQSNRAENPGAPLIIGLVEAILRNK